MMRARRRSCSTSAAGPVSSRLPALLLRHPQVKLFHAGLRHRENAAYNLDDLRLPPSRSRRRLARGTSDDPVMVFDDDEGKRVDHPIEVG